MFRLTSPPQPLPLTALPQRRPWATAVFCAVLFWFFRALNPGGDGDLIVRFTESGAWLIKSEFFGQAIFQASYRIFEPLGYDGRLAVNVASCVCGFFAVAGFCYAMRALAPPLPWVGFGLFAASGIFSLCFSYMEYYPSLLAAMTFWNWSAFQYLRGRSRGVAIALWFCLAVWFHQGMLFAFPALVLLPFAARRVKDIPEILLGLLPLGVLWFFRQYPTLSPIFIEGQSHNWNFVPFVLEPDSKRLYAMFSWAHAHDILYASYRRSVLAWPLLVVVILARWRDLMRTIDGITLFLFVQFLGFLFLSLTWHPNLAMPWDWDLFAVEALPAILLLAHLLPTVLKTRQRIFVIAFLIGFSAFFAWRHIMIDARLHMREFCSIKVAGDEDERLEITVDGRYRGRYVPALLPGRHIVKIICKDRGVAFNYAVVMDGGSAITIQLPGISSVYDPVLHGVGWTPAAPAGHLPLDFRRLESTQVHSEVGADADTDDSTVESSVSSDS